MTSIPIKKHASSIAHRDFSLCLSLYSDASIPFLKRKWSRKRTAQHAGIGRVSTALGTAMLRTCSVRKEFVLQAQGFVQPQSPCVNTRHWACPCDPNLNSGELETGRSSLASGRCGQEAELQSKRESRNPLLFLTSDLSLSPLSFWFWLPHGDWKSHH